MPDAGPAGEADTILREDCCDDPRGRAALTAGGDPFFGADRRDYFEATVIGRPDAIDHPDAIARWGAPERWDAGATM